MGLESDTGGGRAGFQFREAEANVISLCRPYRRFADVGKSKSTEK